MAGNTKINPEETHSNETAYAETGHEIAHEHTIFAEPLFHIGSFTATNSLVNSWIVVIMVLIAAIFLKTRIKTIPGKFQNFVEAIIESLLGVFDSVTSSRKKSLKFFPFIFSFFTLILLSNWMGLLPGAGSVGKVVAEHGENVFVPFMRGATADLNTTLALAIIGVVASHIFGVLSIGAWKHLNKFINFKAILEIPKKIKEDPSIAIVNPIKVFVGLIEIIGEAAKVASLSFRLFGNIFAGEVLLAVMAGILAFALPIPFMFLEVMVGIIQAFIFSLLVLSYLSIMSEEH